MVLIIICFVLLIQNKDCITKASCWYADNICSCVYIRISPPCDTLLSLRRYQPGTLSSSSQTEKLVELVEGEKVAVSGDDSGDERDEGEERPLREAFTVKLLFCPSGKLPTQTSGNIVYATTATICKCFWKGRKQGFLFHSFS